MSEVEIMQKWEPSNEMGHKVKIYSQQKGQKFLSLNENSGKTSNLFP